MNSFGRVTLWCIGFCLGWGAIAQDDNPFLSPPETPFQVPAFDRIEPQHFMPAFTEGMKRQKAAIEAILANPEPPTFANTVVALDQSDDLLAEVQAVFRGLSAANTNQALDRIQREISPKLAAHRDDIALNAALFARIKAVFDQRDELNLDDEQAFLLERLTQRYIRQGALLRADDQARLRAINERLSVLRVTFGQNLLAETNAFELVVSDEAALKGLPDEVQARAAEAAQRAGVKDAWVFTTHKPSLIPFLTYCSDRDLRERLFQAYISRGNNDNAHDNKSIIAEIITLRLERALLLGYPNFAAYAVEERMAKTPEQVDALLAKLWDAALDVAKRECAEMQAIVDREGGDFKLAAWDWWYVAEKLRKQKYALDDAELRPYFQLDRVRDGAFWVAHRLYGLTFHPIASIPKPHPDAQAFQVKDANGAHLAILYMDFHPRESKRQGAWCGAYRGQIKRDGKRIDPIATVVCNLTAPSGDLPALLSLDEVETVFHEFGHALDVMLSNTTYRTRFFSPDFSELPSQIMEHWAIEPAVLKHYAKHVQSGQPIPEDLIEKITRSRLFNQGFKTVEYLAASLLDMTLHELTQADIAAVADIEAFQRKTLKGIGLIPEIEPRYGVTTFAHIVGGYAAGYYSYIWAGVLDNDAFEAFKEAGLFDQKTAKRFRTSVLERNGSADFLSMYRAFRGQDPQIEPLLRNRGLL